MTTDTAAPVRITAEPGQLSIVVERELAAPRELVFRCYSEPALLARWLGPSRMEMRVEAFDLRHGGTWRYVNVEPDGTEYAFHGVFHGPQTPDLMLQTFEFEGFGGQVSLERLELVDLGGGRTLARTTSVYTSQATRDAMIESGMEAGITDGFRKLDALLVELGTQG